jgi:hypothetical protein
MKSWKQIIVSHRNCTWILPDGHQWTNRDCLPKWVQKRTHGCWCSSWRLLKNGEWRIWRDGAYRKPKPGELIKNHSKAALDRLAKLRNGL